jgi:hypothetical protein
VDAWNHCLKLVESQVHFPAVELFSADYVHPVWLGAYLVVYPGQFVVEILWSVRRGAQHAAATGSTDGCDDIFPTLSVRYV